MIYTLINCMQLAAIACRVIACKTKGYAHDYFISFFFLFIVLIAFFSSYCFFLLISIFSLFLFLIFLFSLFISLLLFFSPYFLHTERSTRKKIQFNSGRTGNLKFLKHVCICICIYIYILYM